MAVSGVFACSSGGDSSSSSSSSSGDYAYGGGTSGGADTDSGPSLPPGKCERQVASGSHSECDYEVCAEISDPAACCTTVTDYTMVEGDLCGSDCTDLQTDLAHCGSCDNACNSEDTCVAGKCLPPHVVSCASNPGPHPSYEPACTCKADENEGTPKFEGTTCLHSTDLRTVCCADPGYPAGGGSCSCWFRGEWWCTDDSSTACHCGFYDPSFVGPSSGTCNNAPAADGVAWHCCADKLGQCTCREGVACSASTTEVTTCDVKPAIYPTPPNNSCPTGNLRSTCDSD